MTPNKKLISGIYAITDPTLLPNSILYDKVSQAIDAGISVLQYRNKIADYGLQYKQAEKLNQLCQKNNITFIINDNIKLAQAVCADGIHLGKNDHDLDKARSFLGDKAIIGLSCYNQLAAAIKAEKKGADYIAFGRFFPSKTKPQAVQADISLLTQAKQQLCIPIVAIGGITPHNIKQLLKAGADSIAVINSLFGQQNNSNTYNSAYNRTDNNTYKIAQDLVNQYDSNKLTK